mmetsp:Transcript_45758/g.132007  ORF Transcript_45758/g.132007 Transcript_45758/m.132007 type:complete len:200 (-) Transcript_45758:175-774(-)
MPQDRMATTADRDFVTLWTKPATNATEQCQGNMSDNPAGPNNASKLPTFVSVGEGRKCACNPPDGEKYAHTRTIREALLATTTAPPRSGTKMAKARSRQMVKARMPSTVPIKCHNAAKPGKTASKTRPMSPSSEAPTKPTKAPQKTCDPSKLTCVASTMAEAACNMSTSSEARLDAKPQCTASCRTNMAARTQRMPVQR